MVISCHPTDGFARLQAAVGQRVVFPSCYNRNKVYSSANYPKRTSTLVALPSPPSLPAGASRAHGKGPVVAAMLPPPARPQGTAFVCESL